MLLSDSVASHSSSFGNSTSAFLTLCLELNLAMAKGKKEAVEEPLEKKLWKAADKLRKNMDAAEYKHVVLGLIFLKYISDAFEELHQKLLEGKGDMPGKPRR